MMNNNNRDVLLKIAEAIQNTTTIEQAVGNWLEDHPEATTTVQDGSITKAKLDENLKGTVDDVSDLKSALNEITVRVESINKFDINSITPMSVIGSTGQTQTSQDTFTSDFIKCSPGQIFRLYRLSENGSFITNSTVVWLAEYDEEKSYITRNSFKNNVNVGDSTHYIRFSVPNTFLTDQVICVTFDQVINRTSITKYFSDLGIVSDNTPIKLKVMSFNIGRYSYGASPFYINSDYDTKLLNYKKFFAEQKCDIIGIQENNIYLDGVNSGTNPTNTRLYNYLYPFFADEGNGASIKSKYPLFNQGIAQFTASNRYYVYGTININGKDIFIMTVHLTPNAGETQDLLREQEKTEILNIVNGHSHFIVFGDFNAQSTSFYESFVSAGYHIANGGYLPFEWTYSYDPEDYSKDTPGTGVRFFDNIVTSANITIDYSERKNVYADLSSDHIPFIAYLTIN